MVVKNVFLLKVTIDHIFLKLLVLLFHELSVSLSEVFDIITVNIVLKGLSGRIELHPIGSKVHEVALVDRNDPVV